MLGLARTLRCTMLPLFAIRYGPSATACQSAPFVFIARAMSNSSAPSSTDVASRDSSHSKETKQLSASEVEAVAKVSHAIPSATAINDSSASGIVQILVGASAITAVQQSTTLPQISQAVRAFAASLPKHGHVAFINATLTHLDKLDLPVDVPLVNALISVFPTENSFSTKSMFDAIWPVETLQVLLKFNLYSCL